MCLCFLQPKSHDSKLRNKLKKRNTLSAKRKRTDKIFHIAKGAVSYAAFVPLHELWKQYACACMSL